MAQMLPQMHMVQKALTRRCPVHRTASPPDGVGHVRAPMHVGLPCAVKGDFAERHIWGK